MSNLAQTIIVPKGLIIKWHGLIADIPAGWVICDGNNGSPNLLARFVRGAPVEAGATDGEDTHVLTQAELANHGHSFSESTHTHTSKKGSAGATTSWRTDLATFQSGTLFAGANTSGITIDNAGTDTAHENKPPFFEVIYLYKT